MLGALIEGAAGIEDQSERYQDVRVSPRWVAADDVRAARVVARYAASDGYIAYRWRRAASGLTLDFTGSGECATLRLLLPPDKIDKVALVTLDGVRQPLKIETRFGSRYVVVEARQLSGRVELTWED
jgi:hypothetical protein